MSTSSSPVVFNFYKIIQVWYVGYDDIVFVEGFHRLQKMYPHVSKLYWSQWIMKCWSWWPTFYFLEEPSCQVTTPVGNAEQNISQKVDVDPEVHICMHARVLQ